MGCRPTYDFAVQLLENQPTISAEFELHHTRRMLPWNLPYRFTGLGGEKLLVSPPFPFSVPFIPRCSLVSMPCRVAAPCFTTYPSRRVGGNCNTGNGLHLVLCLSPAFRCPHETPFPRPRPRSIVYSGSRPAATSSNIHDNERSKMRTNTL